MNAIATTETTPEIKAPQIEEIRSIRATPEIKKQIERLIRLNRREKKISDAKNKIRANIIKFVDEKPAIINFGQEQLAKISEKSRDCFDIELFRNKYPELAIQFTRQTIYLELRCA